MKYKKENGFTLVELLVVVVILGIIAIIAIPSINSVKSKNEIKKYQKYQDSLNIAGELFTDSYHEDMFGITGDGCYDVSYDELAKKNLVKDFKTSDISCKNSNTFVHVERINGKYKYETSIKCVNNKGEVIYEDLKNKCNPSSIESLGYPVITASVKHLESFDGIWSKQKDITIEVKSGLGLNSNVTISYGFSRNPGVKPLSSEMKDYRYINKYGENNVKYTFTDDSNFDGSKKNGQYYLYVSGINTLDTGAHHADDLWLGPLNYDNENPMKPSIQNPFHNKWVGKKKINNNEYKFEVTSHDNVSSVSYYQYKFTNSEVADEKIWKTYEGLSGDMIIIPPLTKERNHTLAIRACDNANNCSDYSTSNIKIDKTPPTITNIYNSSGSNETHDNVEIQAKIKDDLSGIDKKNLYYTYNSLDGKHYFDLRYNNDLLHGTWSANRNDKVYFVVYDNAGNYSTAYMGRVHITPEPPRPSGGGGGGGGGHSPSGGGGGGSVPPCKPNQCVQIPNTNMQYCCR